MNVKLMTIVLVLPALGLSASANLLDNGGFEAGELGWLDWDVITGWNRWGSSGYHHNDAAATIGAKAAKLWWDDSGLWQDFEALPGRTYDFRVHCLDWSGDTSANNWDAVIVGEFYDAADAKLTETELGRFDSTLEPDDTWVSIGGPVTAPVNTAYGRVVLRLRDWHENIDGAINFDNVSVIAALPPAASPDYNHDFHVDYADYLSLSAAWTQAAPAVDLNGDAVINIQDLAILTQSWMTYLDPVDAKPIAINPAVTYQEIEGFGASLTDSSAWLIHEFLNASERQAVLTDLFDPDEGIGLSYLRQPMGASDFRLQEYSYDDLPAGVGTDYNLDHFSIAYDEPYIVPTLQQILSINPNVRIMGSPWSPPVWMKTSGHIGGGSLKSDVYPTYANYFVKYIQAYAAHGIPIDAVTLQNEPYYEPWSYAGCRMEPADQVKLVKEMGPAFQTHNLSTKILVWDHNWDRPDYPLAVLADPAARPYIDGVAWHHYGGDVSAQTTVRDAWPDKSVYFTEGSDGTWNDRGFDSDLIRNGRFVVDTLRNWAQTIVKWNLALDQNNGPKIAGGCDTCYGVVTINRQNRQVSPRPHYYALGHASKFLRPGAVRIDSGVSSIPSVAFRNTDGSLVLYAVNPNAFEDTLKLEWNGQWVVRRLPARSIMTFRWDNEPNAAVDVYLTTGDQTALLEPQPPIRFHN